MRVALALWGVLLATAACSMPAAKQQAQVHPLPPEPVAAPADATALFDAQGYRSARYRAPVDRDPAPARRLPQDAAMRWVPGRDALFIDVLPVNGGWRDPLTGKWSLAEAHQTIAGAIWHPETGRANPEADLWQALHDAIARARKGRPHFPVVLFCRADCWMGWNAARRLARNGYGDIYWYADGIEGWRQAGRALQDVEPVTVH